MAEVFLLASGGDVPDTGPAGSDPPGTFTKSGSSASVSTILSDGNLGTGIVGTFSDVWNSKNSGQVYLANPSPAIPVGARVAAVQPMAQLSRQPGGNVLVFLADGTKVYPHLDSSVADDGSPHFWGGPIMYRNPGYNADWGTRGEFAGGSNRLRVGFGTAKYAGGYADGVEAVIEFGVNVTYYRVATVTVLDPAGTELGGRPMVTWDVDAPDAAEGAEQDAYTIRVYDEDTYNTPGFSPNLPWFYRPVWYAGKLSGPPDKPASWAKTVQFAASHRSRQINPEEWEWLDDRETWVWNPPNDDPQPPLDYGVPYRVYVHSRQPWRGTQGAWWTYDYSAFELEQIEGPPPTVTVIPNHTESYAAVRIVAPTTAHALWDPMVDALNGSLDRASYEVERASPFGGWDPVRQVMGDAESAHLLAGDGGVDVFIDYEPWPDTATAYRVRAIYQNEDGDEAVSDWVVVSPTTVSPIGWRVHDLWVPALNLQVRLGGDQFTYASASNTAVRNPKGRRDAVVIGDGPTGGEAISTEFAFTESLSAFVYELIWQRKGPVLLVGPRGERRYVRLVDSRDTGQYIDGGVGSEPIWRSVRVAMVEQQGDPALVGDYMTTEQKAIETARRALYV